LDFTAWVESLKSVAQVLAGFGLVTVLLAYVKHTVERRCWDSFKRRAEHWIDDLVRTQERHPNELSEAQWRFEVEQMLTEANFGPLQIQQLLETAVIVAKGLASDRMIW
jgi:hypothetical protein